MHSTEATVKVTVLMPVYNGASFLREAIDSILGQTYSQFEFLIINDGSTDNSEEIIRSYTDNRIRLVNNENNLGLIATLNKGLDMIETPFVIRMDADDVSMPDRVEKLVAQMLADPTLGACSSWFDTITETGQLRLGGRYSQSFEEIRLKNLYQLHFIHGASIMRMSILNQNGIRFDPSFNHAEDYDLFDRLGNVSKLLNIQLPLYRIRIHGNSVSRMYDSVQQQNSTRVKLRIFRQLGMEVSEHEMELFGLLMYQNYSSLSGNAKLELVQLVNRMIDANKAGNYLPQAFFRHELAVRVLHMCNQLAKNDSGVFGTLMNFKHFRIIDGLGLYARTLLKSVGGLIR